MSSSRKTSKITLWFGLHFSRSYEFANWNLCSSLIEFWFYHHIHIFSDYIYKGFNRPPPRPSVEEANDAVMGEWHVKCYSSKCFVTELSHPTVERKFLVLICGKIKNFWMVNCKRWNWFRNSLRNVVASDRVNRWWNKIIFTSFISSFWKVFSFSLYKTFSPSIKFFKEFF